MISATEACGTCIQLPTVVPPPRSRARTASIAACLSNNEILALRPLVQGLKRPVQLGAPQQELDAIADGGAVVGIRVADEERVSRRDSPALEHRADRVRLRRRRAVDF